MSRSDAIQTVRGQPEMTDNRAAITALRSVAQAVRQLSRVTSVASRDAADEIAFLLQQEFDTGADPYGASWAPLAESTLETGRTPPPLTDTGALRDIDVSALPGAGLAIALGEEYGAFHQIGFRVGKTDVPARPILPTRGLPDMWRRAIADAVDAAWERSAP